MVAQQHERLVPQILHQSFAFFMVQRQALIAMVGDLMLEQAGVLANRQQAFLLCRYADTGHCVKVDDVMRVLARSMNSRMDGETGRIDEAGCVLNDIALQVDLDQAGGGHLLEIPAIGVDQKMVLRPGHTGRDVGEDHVVPPMQRNKAVEGRQFYTGGPFRLGHSGFQ